MEKIRKTGIGIVGLPGAGKSLVSEVATERYGIPTIVMGDIIRQLCVEKGLDITPKNLGDLMVNIRKEEGMDAVAKRTLSKVAEVKGDIVIIDGLRSYEEVELFRARLTRFLIMAMHASPHTRFMRLQKRRRFDDPQNFKIFQERDFREIIAGIAKIFALADIMLVNEGRIRPLKNQISTVLRLIRENKWR
ncbi:MAG TPA: AAA family ATPase [Candidatus Deferrimicrobium sp.]|nr:AAA family ATPase [Candidatus Deferrimicrobium sp.]